MKVHGVHCELIFKNTIVSVTKKKKKDAFTVVSKLFIPENMILFSSWYCVLCWLLASILIYMSLSSWNTEIVSNISLDTVNSLNSVACQLKKSFISSVNLHDFISVNNICITAYFC